MSAKPLRTKEETTDALVEIINILEKAAEYPVKLIQADWGGEFRNKGLQAELRQRGIQLKETVPKHSETNAVAERANRTNFTTSKTALIAAEMPKGYWDKASLWAIYVKNHLPYKLLPKGLTLVEILLPGTHAECLRTNLRPFGQKVKCFDYEVTDKLSARGYEGRIIGYTNTFQTYWVLDSTGKTRLAKNPRPIQLESPSQSEDGHVVQDDNMSKQLPTEEPDLPIELDRGTGDSHSSTKKGTQEKGLVGNSRN